MTGNNTSQRAAVRGGLYLVVDPANGWEQVAPVLAQAIAGGIDLIQVWDHWLPGQSPIPFIEQLCAMAHASGIPVFVNENWPLLKDTAADGIHFDRPPASLAAIRQSVGRSFLCGITCNNDLGGVQWAVDNGLDYVSFCSLFPSATAQSCELVRPETIETTRRLTTMPVFMAGGITLDNIQQLSLEANDGIAIVSGIMKAGDPEQRARQYKKAIQDLKQRTI